MHCLRVTAQIVAAVFVMCFAVCCKASYHKLFVLLQSEQLNELMKKWLWHTVTVLLRILCCLLRIRHYAEIGLDNIQFDVLWHDATLCASSLRSCEKFTHSQNAVIKCVFPLTEAAIIRNDQSALMEWININLTYNYMYAYFSFMRIMYNNNAHKVYTQMCTVYSA